jgi:hypothetical protein
MDLVIKDVDPSSSSLRRLLLVMVGVWGGWTSSSFEFRMVQQYLDLNLLTLTAWCRRIRRHERYSRSFVDDLMTQSLYQTQKQVVVAELQVLFPTRKRGSVYRRAIELVTCLIQVKLYGLDQLQHYLALFFNHPLR